MSERDDIERAAMDLFEQALDQPSPDRQDWIAQQTEVSDPVQKRAAELLRLDQRSQDIEWTGAALSIASEQDSPLLARVGAYRITRMIAQGGMGAVYEGERAAGDFDHKVAIKVIRPGLLKDSLIERFERERQVLAEMNHPNVARLFDGGTLPDGAPFMVMEYVDGVGITDYCKEHLLGVSARIDLFVKVCIAVRHAHQNLIVHRDITPSNVLVDGEGEPKLIDFGIAKPDAGQITEPSADDATDRLTNGPPSLASLSFTPGFAAPERKTGGANTVLADIYSLGKLLEALLRDCPQNDDLDAVITKATREHPEDRYSSADALAEDLDNFRTHFPLDAREGGKRYRIGKFIRRQRGAVVAFSAVALVLVGGLTVTSLLYAQAEAARVQSDERFEQVRELSRFMLFDLYDELSDVPGTTNSLNNIATKTQFYLDNLALDANPPTDVRLDAALGYLRLGNILGNPIGANLGRREESSAALRKSVEQLRQLHGEEPADPDISRGLAEALYALSVYEYIAVDDNLAAHELATESAALHQTVSRSSAGTQQDKLAWIESRIQAALPLSWIDRGDEAVAALETARADNLALIENGDTSEAAKSQSTKLNSMLADVLTRIGAEDPEAQQRALGYFGTAIEGYIRLAQTAEKPDAFRQNLSATYFRRALLYYDLDRHEEAVRDLTAAEAIDREILSRDPDDYGTRTRLNTFAEQKAASLSLLGRFDEAVATALAAQRIKAAMLAEEPGDPGRTRELANGLQMLAEIYDTAGKTGNACTQYRRSRDLYARLKRAQSLSDYDQESLDAIDERIATCR